MWRRAKNISRSKGAAATAATVTAAVAAAEKIMNRLIIQVISLNYLEDKINGFHVIARQRQINHISQHFPFFLLLFRSVPFFLFLFQLSSAQLCLALLLRIQKLLSFWIYILKNPFFFSALLLCFSVSFVLLLSLCLAISSSMCTSVSLSAGEHIR